MPRYFTSPPPVYARNWGNGQNLVESTKIESQIVASKKVHRREKKEKKKEKKLKNDKSLKQHHIPTKQVSDDSEQFEKSCVTQEHEQPHQAAYLSDGSQNSKKRTREASPTVESIVKATSVAGNPLRIRFVFKKPKAAEVVPQEAKVVPHEEPICSTSGTERPSVITNAVSGSRTCDLDCNLLSTSLESDKAAIPSESNKRKKHRPSKESRYNTLFDDWVPPCISLEKDDSNDSEDWLFGTRRQVNASTKTSNKNDEDSSMNLQISEDSLLPRARFLSEVGIFALPYTVPF